MEAQERNFCCGCLGSGRKMVAVHGYWTKQCFMSILREIPMYEPESDVSVWLCWECEALLRRFTEFKQQVAQNFNILRDYEMRKLDMKFPYWKARLTAQKLNNIDYPEIEQESYPDQQLTDEIKIEIPIDIPDQVKCEIESNSDRDDDLLINYVSKKKKAVKRKTKQKPVELYREVELTESEIEEERREMELREEYVNAMFRCEKCIVSFPNADDLKDHVAAKHDLSPSDTLERPKCSQSSEHVSNALTIEACSDICEHLGRSDISDGDCTVLFFENAAHHKCPICTCSFVSEISYNYHAKKHKLRYECCACAARSRSKRAAQKHRDTAHGIDPSFENHNSQENGRTGDGNINTTGVKSEVTFPCEQCAKTFRWKTSLRKHLETHRIEAGQKRRPYCEPCKLSFTTTSNLQKHVKTSSKHQIQLKLRKLQDTLPEDSTTPEKQQAHIEEIKSSVNNARQQFPCSHCGKRFQWRGNLLRHLHSHTARANGELVCAPCNRTFSSHATFKQHMRLSRAHVSEHEFPHACPECGRRFANKTRLRDHRDWDHRRVFAHHCHKCQKVFKSHTSLYLHRQVVHKMENSEHLCDHCGKPFPNHAKLRSHIIALHTSESPYKCTSCAARFSWHSCLSRHVRRVHKRK